MNINVLWDMTPYGIVEIYWRFIYTLKTEATRSSETSVHLCQIVWRYFLEDGHPFLFTVYGFRFFSPNIH